MTLFQEFASDSSLHFDQVNIAFKCFLVYASFLAAMQ